MGARGKSGISRDKLFLRCLWSWDHRTVIDLWIIGIDWIGYSHKAKAELSADHTDTDTHTHTHTHTLTHTHTHTHSHIHSHTHSHTLTYTLTHTHIHTHTHTHTQRLNPLHWITLSFVSDVFFLHVQQQ